MHVLFVVINRQWGGGMRYADHWIWEFISYPISWSNWLQDYPDLDSGDCMRIHEDKKWENAPCDVPQYYICESNYVDRFLDY